MEISTISNAIRDTDLALFSQSADYYPIPISLAIAPQPAGLRRTKMETPPTISNTIRDPDLVLFS